MTEQVLYEAEITGIPVRVSYTRRCVDTILLPLIEQIRALQAKKDRRVIVFLAAPPAAGKSTLASFLQTLCPELTVLTMDGFHHYQSYLLSHTTLLNGETVPMTRIKGAPETFDLERLTAFIKRAAAGEEFGWPSYDRLLHNPRENACRVTGNMILLEGNYLLLEENGWRDLKQYADLSIMIRADENILRPRLIERKLNLGKTLREAENFADTSDLPNAHRVLSHSAPADITLQLTETGEYVAAENG